MEDGRNDASIPFRIALLLSVRDLAADSIWPPVTCNPLLCFHVSLHHFKTRRMDTACHTLICLPHCPFLSQSRARPRSPSTLFLLPPSLSISFLLPLSLFLSSPPLCLCTRVFVYVCISGSVCVFACVWTTSHASENVNLTRHSYI